MNIYFTRKCLLWNYFLNYSKLLGLRQRLWVYLINLQRILSFLSRINLVSFQLPRLFFYAASITDWLKKTSKWYSIHTYIAKKTRGWKRFKRWLLAIYSAIWYILKSIWSNESRVLTPNSIILQFLQVKIPFQNWNWWIKPQDLICLRNLYLSVIKSCILLSNVRFAI